RRGMGRYRTCITGRAATRPLIPIRATIPMRTATLSLLLVVSAAACANAQDPPETTIFTDVTATHMPADPSLHALDGAFVDVDGDGDLDIAVAVEGGANRIYLNDGTGRFTWQEGALGDRRGDFEHVLSADFDGD